jgi:hypothetical protein
MTLSITEHKIIGEALKILRKGLLNDDDVHKKYRTKKLYKESHEAKAIKLDEHLKNHMEEIMYKDHIHYIEKMEKENKNFKFVNVYYGELDKTDENYINRLKILEILEEEAKYGHV